MALKLVFVWAGILGLSQAAQASPEVFSIKREATHFYWIKSAPKVAEGMVWAEALRECEMRQSAAILVGNMSLKQGKFAGIAEGKFRCVEVGED
jgi:hypothetical protein